MDKYRESRGSFASASNAPKKASNYGSEFIRLSKVIGNNIQKIQSNVRQMKTILNDLERTPEDTRKLSQLHEVQQKTNSLVKDTGTYIQDLNKIPKSSGGTEQRQQRIQRERLVSQFTKTVDDFQVVQKQEKEKTKEQVIRDRKSVKRYKESVLGPLPEETAVVAEDKGQMLMVQVDVTDLDLELMREREEELRKLESDIMDINEIFTDLGLMIREQGEVIDTIESNVETAAANVEEGTNQLHKAHEHRMSARKKKCIIIVIVSVVIVIIIIIIILASVLSKR